MGVVALAAVVLTWMYIFRGPSTENFVFGAVVDVLSLYCFFLAGLVAIRRPGNAVGPLLAFFALDMAILDATSAYDQGYAVYPDRFHVSPYYVAFGEAAFALWYIPPALLMLYFPDGRLLSRRWRLVTIGLVVVLLVGTLVGPFSDETFDAPYDKLVNPLPQATGWLLVVANVLTFGVFLLGLLALLIACLTAMIIRYRRSAGAERAQLKWFAFGAAMLPGCLLLCWLSLLVFGNEDILGVALFVLLVSIPTATTIGLLRHQLYDVDRAVAATVTYAVVTVVLLGLFAGASFVGGVVFGRSSPTVAAAATALCALALAPLYRRLRRLVDRRLYPVRRRVLEALAVLRTDIHRGTAVPEQLVQVLQRSLGDPELRVGFRVPGATGDVDLLGRPVTEAGTPVLLADEQVGVLGDRGPPFRGPC